MKAFKSIDCVIQVILIVVGLLFGLMSKDMLAGDYFLLGYFLVGGWQVLSVIIHFFYTAPYKTRLRKIYLVTLGLVILAIVLSIPMDGLIVALFGLLFFSPVMAVYYLVACIWETQRLSLIMEQGPGSVDV